MRFFRLFFRSVADFFRDDGIMFAGAISFFTVMTIVPFCLFLITIFGSFLGENQDFYRFFLSKLVSLFPKITGEITGELQRLITYRGLGTLSLVLYGLISFQLFSALETSMNGIFRIDGRRHFLISVILSLVVVTLICGFLLISFVATSAVSMLQAYRSLFPGIELGAIAGFLIRYVIPLVLVFSVLLTLYVFLPRRTVRVSKAAAGALLIAVLLEVAKHIFTFYVVKVVQLGTIYGPLSAFFIFLLWVFYSSCLFLIGAEVVRNLGPRKGA